MRRIELGRTGLKVSQMCLGTMTFGEQNTEAEAHAQLDYALARGVNFIDAAEMYPVMPSPRTQGRTEAYIGSWLKRSGRRNDVVLATKAAGPNRSLGWIRSGRQDLNAEHLKAAVEASLRRLRTDTIDLYQLHWPSRNVANFGVNTFNPERERPSVPIRDTLEALADLIKAGKIRHIGVSNESPWGVCEFIKQSELHGLPRIASIQNLFNLTARGFETSFLDEVCFREQVSLLAYSPLAFGQLSGKYVDNPHAHGRLNLFPKTWSPRYLRPAVFQAAAEYAALARSHGMSPAQMALAWCSTRWFVGSTIIGATTLAQLKENLDAATLSLPSELVDAINAVHARITNPGQ